MCVLAAGTTFWIIFLLKQKVKSLRPILCTFLCTLLLTVTSLYGTPARALKVFLVLVSAVAGVSRCTAATRLRSNELNIASQLEPFPVHIALLRNAFRLTIDVQRANFSFNFAALKQDFCRIIPCKVSIEACGSVIHCPRCNFAVVYLNIQHELTLK